jgi:hypothetical protein
MKSIQNKCLIAQKPFLPEKIKSSSKKMKLSAHVEEYNQQGCI